MARHSREDRQEMKMKCATLITTVLVLVLVLGCGDDDAPLPCACELGGDLVMCGESSCSEGTEYLCDLSGLVSIGRCGEADAGSDAGTDAGFFSECTETCGEGQVCAGERCVDFEAQLTGEWFPTALDATNDVVAVGRGSGTLSLGGVEVQAGPGAVVIWNVTRGWTWDIVTASDVMPTSVASSDRAVAVVGSHESPFSFAGADFTERGDPTAFVLEFTAEGLPNVASSFSGTRNYDPLSSAPSAAQTVSLCRPSSSLRGRACVASSGVATSVGAKKVAG